MDLAEEPIDVDLEGDTIELDGVYDGLESGRWIIVSPQNHQIHHSADEEHRDLNFSVCPLWDRMFGTWYAGSTRPSAYGIGDRAHVERPFTQWLIDIWIFYRDFARSAAGGTKSALARVRRRRSQDTSVSVPAE